MRDDSRENSDSLRSENRVLIWCHVNLFEKYPSIETYFQEVYKDNLSNILYFVELFNPLYFSTLLFLHLIFLS